ncbi:MAG: ABC transporter permease [Bacteroidales bacterium]|nr:ABC transporter permease [Candidatus Cacconaster scatequi]
MGGLKKWFGDAVLICRRELKRIVSDGGMTLIFFVAGLGYPLLYNCVYHNGILEDTPVAVVDESHSVHSRRYIRKVDATRELRVAQKCATMAEAEEFMRQRKVKGVLYFPEDFGRNIDECRTATLSIYADMSSFLYYKNLMLGANFVMLDEMEKIKIERYGAGGMSDQEISQLIEAIPYEENNPYNNTFSYSIFFLSAALLLIIQQVMFYGVCLMAGTVREEGSSYLRLCDRANGPHVGSVVAGRAAAYWGIFMVIGVYIACLVPAMFGLPQRGNFTDILVLLLIYVTDCVFFATAWSSFFHRRETVLVTLLFISPIVMFLTGFSWPATAFPKFWRLFSYIFPTSFACPAFINLNTAGCELSQVGNLLNGLLIQTAAYCLISVIAARISRARVRGACPSL